LLFNTILAIFQPYDVKKQLLFYEMMMMVLVSCYNNDAELD